MQPLTKQDGSVQTKSIISISATNEFNPTYPLTGTAFEQFDQQNRTTSSPDENKKMRKSKKQKGTNSQKGETKERKRKTNEKNSRKSSALPFRGNPLM